MLFQYGKLYFTRGINDRMAEDEWFAKFILDSFKKHLSGDWGELDKEDKQANFQSLKDGSRILSKYVYSKDEIYIITESDRSSTTILFCSEY